MRKIGTGNENEQITVLGTGPIPEVQLDAHAPGAESAKEAPPIVQTRIKPGAEVDDSEAAALAPKVRWFRVKKGGTVLENGFRTRLKEGKEINTANYNVRKLQQQGIQLEEFDPVTVTDDQIFPDF